MATENQFTLSPDQNDFISYLVVSGNTSNLKRANQSSTIINSDPPEHPLGNDHSSLKYQWIKKTVVPARKKSYKSFCNGGIRSEWPTKYKLKAGYNPGDWLRGDVDIIRPLTNSEYKEQSVAGSSTSSTTTTTPPPSPTSSTTNMAPNKTPRFDTKDMKSAIDKVDKFDNIGEEQAGTYYLKCSIEEYITGKVNVSKAEVNFMIANAGKLNWGVNQAFHGLTVLDLPKVKDESNKLNLHAINFTIFGVPYKAFGKYEMALASQSGDQAIFLQGPSCSPYMGQTAVETVADIQVSTTDIAERDRNEGYLNEVENCNKCPVRIYCFLTPDLVHLSNEYFQGPGQTPNQKSLGCLTAMHLVTRSFPEYHNESHLEAASTFLFNHKNSPLRGDQKAIDKLLQERIANVSWQVHVMGEEQRQIDYEKQDVADDSDSDDERKKKRMEAVNAIKASSSPKRR